MWECSDAKLQGRLKYKVLKCPILDLNIHRSAICIHLLCQPDYNDLTSSYQVLCIYLIKIKLFSLNLIAY